MNHGEQVVWPVGIRRPAVAMGHGLESGHRDPQLLKCLALHEAYSRRAREEVSQLDVLYPPIVRLEKREDLNELEADVDAVRIKCLAEANPKPDVVWRKAGGESIFR